MGVDFGFAPKIMAARNRWTAPDDGLRIESDGKQEGPSETG
jgi:hypothetical protein